MFNGFIKELALVVSFDGKTLNLKAKYRPNLGESIAVNGACLSVTNIYNGGFCVELSSESVSLIATKNLKNLVHIEPAMKLGDKIDGHLTQGHIDGVGIITDIKKLHVGSDFYINLPKNLLPFVATKGSIAIDGVSLTINEVLENGVRLTIIPITLNSTLFGSYKVGREVNVETDLLARYAQRILAFSKQNNQKSELTWDDVRLMSSWY